MEEATTLCYVNTEELWDGKENNGAGHLWREPLLAKWDWQSERYTIRGLHVYKNQFNVNNRNSFSLVLLRSCFWPNNPVQQCGFQYHLSNGVRPDIWLCRPPIQDNAKIYISKNIQIEGSIWGQVNTLFFFFSDNCPCPTVGLGGKVFLQISIHN